MKYCKHQLLTGTCEWCRKEKQGVGKWKVNIRPRTGLQIKYLRMVMTENELDELIWKYKEHIKNALDITEAVAKRIKDEQASRLGIEFEVKRESEMNLRIDIGGCETLRFDFESIAQILKDASTGWKTHR